MTAVRAVLRAAGTPLRLVLIAVINVYRVTLGGLLAGHCRFYPSCSRYAEAAIKSRGALEGTGFAIWRVLRCGPFTAGGIDHAPAPRTGRTRAAYDGVIPSGSER